jgi:hypothetical protein
MWKALTAPFLVASVMLAAGDSASVRPTIGAESAGEETVIRQRQPTLAGVTLAGPPGAVSSGGYLVSATYPAGAELSWKFSPEPLPGQHYFQRVSDTQTYVVFLYPPAPKQEVELHALIVQPGRDVAVSGRVVVARDGEKPDDGGDKPGPVGPTLEGTAKVSHDAILAYGRNLAATHRELKGKKLAGRAAFFEAMKRTQAARESAFKAFDANAEKVLHADPWGPEQHAIVDRYLEEAATGLEAPR